METEERNGRISEMDGILFTLALEVGLLQMRILDGSFELRRPKTLDKRDKIKLDKLLRDRELAKDILRRTLVEVAESGEWEALKQAVRLYVQRATLALSRRERQEQLLISCEEYANALKTKGNQWAFELRNADKKVALLRDKLKDDLLNANTRLNFVETWLGARAEALELRCKAPRAPAPRPDHEQRIHAEQLNAFQLQTKGHEEAIENWRVRYADDTARMNELLVEKREQLQVVVARHEELQKMFDLHAGEMRSWLSFKQQRAERLAREERVRKAATRIQAWWRGVMVRRAFGPFRYLRNVKKSPSKTKKK